MGPQKEIKKEDNFEKKKISRKNNNNKKIKRQG